MSAFATDPAASPSASFRRNRSMLLDCIRGVAILAVLVFHVATRYDRAHMDEVAEMARRFGMLGVDVFFPLSGYLITRFLLQSQGAGSIGVFFQRRFFRIVPLYVTAVTLFLAASLVLGIEREVIDRIWIDYLFLTGWFIFFDGPQTVPYTITWSLSVEEFAYVLFGLCALASRRRLPLVLAVASVASLALRFYLNIDEQVGVYNFPPARLDSIAIGGLVAAAVLSGRIRGLAPGLALAALLTYGLAMAVPELWSTLKYSFITFATTAAIVLFDTRLKGRESRLLAPLADIGFYSYFTYLFHFFNIHILIALWDHAFAEPAPFWGMVLAALAVTQLQAVLSFRFFEGPVMAFGRRLERKGKRHEGAAPVRSSA